MAITTRVGDLRFRHPQAHDPYVGIHNATVFGLSCPQQATTLPIPNGFPEQTIDYLELLDGPGPTLDGEDCEEAGSVSHRAILMMLVGLNLNVVAPAHARPGSNIPVVVVCTL